MKRMFLVLGALAIAVLFAAVGLVVGLSMASPLSSPEIGSQVFVTTSEEETSDPTKATLSEPKWGMLLAANEHWVCVQYDHARVWYPAKTVFTVIVSDN